ncbi:serine/threonine protein kinase, partial [Candidatus Woesearchaeota archaeon]|nr:serine/threonine protein kinase [Candidatus Woesearchaeota archaeon]
MSDSEINSIPEKVRNPNDYTGRTTDGYALGEKLGAGTFGVVYVGERDGKKFSLKLLPANDPLLASTLQKELDAQKGLKHPNIREIYEFHPDARFDDNGDDPLSLLVMEYVDGTHLKVAEVDNNALYVIALQVKEALKAAHDHGIINKDVKPTNILVTQDGQAKVCDFGLAKRVEEHSMQVEQSMPISDAAPAQRSLQSPGTYGYFPPGEKADSPAYDLYSFGVTLYQMIMQKVEFPDADVYEDVEEKAEKRELENPSALAELVKALTLKRHKRPKDFAEVEKTEGWKAIQQKADEIAKYGKIAEELYEDFKQEVRESELEDKDDINELISTYYPDPEKIPILRQNLTTLIEMERKAREKIETTQEESEPSADLEKSLQIYEKYISLLNQLNPKKITDELADNIAYAAWKEGLEPEYVDYIVESIARRRKKGLFRRVKEYLFGKKDSLAGKSKQEIRVRLREFARTVTHPKSVKRAKRIGRKYNVFVEDIVEETVRELAKVNARAAADLPYYHILNDTRRFDQFEAIARYCDRQNVNVENILEEAAQKVAETRKDRIGPELMDALRKRYSKAFQNRPDYHQISASTAKIAKKPTDTEHSLLSP